MGSMFPALDIRPVESPLQQYAQVQQIRAGQQQIEAQRIQNQQQQRMLADQDAATRALAGWDGKDYDALPTLVKNAGGSANAVLGMTKNIFAVKQQASEIAKNDSITNQNNVDSTVKTHDEYRGRILNVVGMTDPTQKQNAWAAEIAKEQASGTQLPPGISTTYPGDDTAKAVANSFALGSQLVKEADERQKLSIDAWKNSGGQLVNAVNGQTIGGLDAARIATINAGLKTRFNVLNPGKDVPDYFQLQNGANPTDFDRMDKLLEATEKAKGTLAQQEQTQAIRAQTFELSRDKSDMKPVMGNDPKTGNAVMVPRSQAQQMGIQNPMDADADTVNKSLAARHWLSLAQKPADPGSKDPADQSITQLINNLDKEGKLGPLASRWNDFMARKWGAGDPEYAALNTKMGLSTTLLQQAHVGNRGSAQLLEHFEDLANQKKLDGPTLKAGFNSEINYMRERAMDPNPPNYGGTAPGRSAAPNSSQLPQGGGKAIDKATAMQFYQAAGNDPAKAKQLAIQNGWKVPQAQ